MMQNTWSQLSHLIITAITTGMAFQVWFNKEEIKVHTHIYIYKNILCIVHYHLYAYVDSITNKLCCILCCIVFVCFCKASKISQNPRRATLCVSCSGDLCPGFKICCYTWGWISPTLQSSWPHPTWPGLLKKTNPIPLCWHPHVGFQKCLTYSTRSKSWTHASSTH